ncbi:MAG: sulfotransferase [Bacteroidia bacterium]|nr:sulfotransferase [Bacteroidia bacterium]
MSLGSGVKKALHHVVPYEFNDIFGLAGRLMKSKHSAGRSAMFYSAMGLALSPLDYLLRYSERAKYRKAPMPSEPIIFVVGAPRSGTTLAGQSLIMNLPVNYFNNLTSVFPYSPITAMNNFGWMLNKDKKYVNTSSLYGRTVKWSEPNDALYFWDRWMDKNRKKIPQSFSEEQKKDIQQFFGAFELYHKGPLLQKVNRMNTFAHLVADVLPNARFVCLDRSPIFHAQSLLVARRFIHGDDSKSYGIQGDKPEDLLPTENPIESVCKQVIFHKEIIQKQKERIGDERFIHMPYESFCGNPVGWVKEISERFLGFSPEEKELEKNIPTMKLSSKVKIDKNEFDEIIKTFKRIRESGETSKDLISEAELVLSK